MRQYTAEEIKEINKHKLTTGDRINLIMQGYLPFSTWCGFTTNTINLDPQTRYQLCHYDFGLGGN